MISIRYCHDSLFLPWVPPLAPPLHLASPLRVHIEYRVQHMQHLSSSARRVCQAWLWFHAECRGRLPPIVRKRLLSHTTCSNPSQIASVRRPSDLIDNSGLFVEVVAWPEKRLRQERGTENHVPMFFQLHQRIGDKLIDRKSLDFFTIMLVKMQ